MNITTAVKSFVIYPRPNPQAHLRLFCFPYAGGTAAMFREWPRYLPPEVELCAVQYPGRGTRMHELLIEEIPKLAHMIGTEIKPFLNKPFAFFGHSMGALVSFELARRLQREGQSGPLQLFVSGCTAPHIRNVDDPTYNLPDTEFIDELRRLKGTPAEVLDNAELMQLMLPIIRADFKASQTYQYIPGEPLSCPVRACGGLKDEMVTRDKIEGWGEHTTSAFMAQMFPGDHFFLNTSQSLLTRILAQDLIARMRPNGRSLHSHQG
jgi:medium-chain acyl-[acyl-carrier-protein] hydrolase